MSDTQKGLIYVLKVDSGKTSFEYTYHIKSDIIQTEAEKGVFKLW